MTQLVLLSAWERNINILRIIRVFPGQLSQGNEYVHTHKKDVYYVIHRGSKIWENQHVLQYIKVKHTVVHAYHGKLFSRKEIKIWYAQHLGWTREHYAWKKSTSKVQNFYDSIYIKFSKWYNYTNGEQVSACLGFRKVGKRVEVWL